MAEDSRSTDHMRLLPGEATGTIARLELLARGLVEGFIAGRHRSPHKGFSVEFAEHRQYVPGDDLRGLDWRVLGRTDRYYVKQYVEETNMRATIIVDASGSMRYAGNEAARLDGKPATKFQYAQYLAASLAYLLINQQDAVGLVTFDREIRRYLPARSRRSQVRMILEELSATEPGGETGLAEILHDIAERIHRRGMVIIISDLFDNAEEITKALHHFHYRKHEVIVLHVMAEEELNFPFQSFTHFRDLEEVYDTQQIDPHALRRLYLQRVAEFVDTIEEGCGQMKADYVPLSTKAGFDQALSDYLSRRRHGR